ncbi:MAG TPA: MaoC family dehydratase [Trebonia sp.]|jgi:acyl dehydratase
MNDSRQLCFQGIDELAGWVGRHLGYSDWLLVDQARINLFADATGDHQWIHVDPERAAGGPFGATVAHGYLTLSLIPSLVSQIYKVEGVPLRINYGSDKVRFPAPVRAGSRIRAGAELLRLDRGASGVRSTVRVTVEIEGEPKPACVAETLGLFG